MQQVSVICFHVFLEEAVHSSWRGVYSTYTLKCVHEWAHACV